MHLPSLPLRGSRTRPRVVAWRPVLKAPSVRGISISLSAVNAFLLATAANLDCGGSHVLPPTASDSFDFDSDASARFDASQDAASGWGPDGGTTLDASQHAVIDGGPDGGETVSDSDAGVRFDASQQAAGDGGRDGGTTLDASLETSADDVAASCAAETVTARASAAKSTGYSGTWEAYGALGYVACTAVTDCVSSCAAAGGTPASCSEASQCLEGTCVDGGTSCSPSLMCAPPSYWLDTSGALGEPDSGAGEFGAPADDPQNNDNGYRDTLELTGFGLSVPAGSSILGIAFQVDRSATDDQASDKSVRVLKAGQAVGTEHGRSDTWPLGVFAPVVYGDANDTWGVSWTSADVNDPEFGVAITPQYLSASGSDHALIDSVRATISYKPPGCP